MALSLRPKRPSPTRPNPRRDGDITTPPVPPTMLRHMVLRARRHAPATGAGPHLRRKEGQSLDFKEYRIWQPGDDIRAVDWRASARTAQGDTLLARSFHAEERLTFLILIDNPPEMRLPETMPKLLYALWCARAMAALAAGQGDCVILARLFPAAQTPASCDLGRGAQSRARAAAWCNSLWQDCLTAPLTPVVPDPLGPLVRLLPPASAVAVISDMLFDDPAAQFAHFARKAQEKRRSLSVVALDTLAHEIALLRAAREFHLIRPETSTSSELQQFAETPFQTASTEVAHFLHQRHDALARGGLDWPRQHVTWPLPDPAGDGIDALKSLFAATFPRLPLLAGLQLGRGR